MGVEVVRLERGTLQHEYGVDTQRLLPWAVLNSPFEGAWCVARVGTRSTLHSHHELEIFIAVRGEAVVECDGQRSPFHAGDVALFPPGQAHRLLNDGGEDFEFYSVWWDEEMAARFISRSRAGTQP
jgi:mannose-6-phosphate isomerase-like protein (cupin superfamily)